MTDSDITHAYSTNGKTYVADTQQLKRWNKVAVSIGYNRALSDVGVADLHPLGKHLVQVVIPDHKNADGLHTVRLLLMMKGNTDNYQTEPNRATLDISHRHWREFCENNEAITY